MAPQYQPAPAASYATPSTATPYPPPPYQPGPSPYYSPGYPYRRHHEGLLTISMLLIAVQFIIVGLFLLVFMVLGMALPVRYGAAGLAWMFALVFLGLLALGILAIKFLWDFRKSGVYLGGIFSVVMLLLYLLAIGASTDGGAILFYGFFALIALANLVTLAGSTQYLS